MKCMEVKEFVDLGLLQEINRLLLHPMGLALSVMVEEDGSAAFHKIIDVRDNPEGTIFGDKVIDVKKVQKVNEMLEAKKDDRIQRFGWHIQPLGEDE